MRETGYGMSDLAIETRDLVKHYGRVEAVNGLTLSVPRGAIYALVGRNGSGKTTTIRMLLDLARPDAGTARVLGIDSHADRVTVLERVGFVSDRPLPGGWTGEQLVKFNRGFYPRWSDELLARYVRVFDISNEAEVSQPVTGQPDQDVADAGAGAAAGVADPG